MRAASSTAGTGRSLFPTRTTDRLAMTMTSKERSLLHAHMANCKKFLEFGAGDSTVHVAGVESIVRVDSVESSPEYVERNLMPDASVRRAVDSGKLTFHFVDIGKTKKWGYPRDVSKKKLWPDYSANIFSLHRDFDLVLVDGRFRVACTLNSILGTPDDCTIIIHDFWNRKRGGSHLVLEFLEVVERTHTMAVLTKKPGSDVARITKFIDLYKYNPHDKSLYHDIRYGLAASLSRAGENQRAAS